jgi:hypothetical protein
MGWVIGRLQRDMCSGTLAMKYKKGVDAHPFLQYLYLQKNLRYSLSFCIVTRFKLFDSTSSKMHSFLTLAVAISAILAIGSVAYPTEFVPLVPL